MNDLMDFVASTDDIVVTLENFKTKETLYNKDGSPMTITVYAPFSKEAKAVVHGITDKRLADATEKALENPSEPSRGIKLTAAKMEEYAVEGLAKCTKSWNITLGGEQPGFTVDAAVDLYSKPFLGQAIKDKIEEAQANSVSFMKG